MLLVQLSITIIRCYYKWNSKDGSGEEARKVKEEAKAEEAKEEAKAEEAKAEEVKEEVKRTKDWRSSISWIKWRNGEWKYGKVNLSMNIFQCFNLISRLSV